ncbi:MAG: ATP-binding protein [Hyphomicrobiaceae bacterium]
MSDAALEVSHRQRSRTGDTSKAQLREARERLTHGSSLRPEFEYELLSIFVRNELGAIATIQVLAVVFALSSAVWAPKLEAIVWLLMVIFAKVVLLELCRRFLALPKAQVNVGLWRRRFYLAELVCGLVWAGFALIGLNATEGSSHVFVFAFLIVVLAIRMTFASIVMPVLYAGTVPMTLAVVARLALQGDPFYWALASMAVGVHIYFFFIAKGLQATTLSMLEFRAQKDSLIADLAEQSSIADEARKRAEAANVAKSRFLATMSHELRTPLNAILGFSEVMKCELLGPIDNPNYKEYAGNIHDSGRHLLHLINEILDLSRIEAGRYELHEEPVRLADVAEDCHRLLKLRAESKGLQVVLDIEEDLPQLWCDERAMRQVLLNLMSNAIKFTPKGGFVHLTVVTTVDGGQAMSVRDTGPGIPKEEIPKVLQAFGQGSLAHQTAEGGTGLGLSIVKSLVELHGGAFELLSELRKGTEGIIVLPATRVMHAVPPLQPLGQERHRPGPAPTGNHVGSRRRRPRLAGVHPAGRSSSDTHAHSLA